MITINEESRIPVNFELCCRWSPIAKTSELFAQDWASKSGIWIRHNAGRRVAIQTVKSYEANKKKHKQLAFMIWHMDLYIIIIMIFFFVWLYI